MKNKFLLMAVISALAALVIVPSTMAATSENTDVSANVESGEFYLTAGTGFTSAISLGTTARNVEKQYVSATRPFDGTNNYFELKDYYADRGAVISVMLDEDFIYDDTVAGGPDIDGENLMFYAQETSGDAVSPTCEKNTYGGACTVLLGSTSIEASATSNYRFNDYYYSASKFFKKSATVGSLDEYLTASTTKPYKLRFGMEKLHLQIPADSLNGAYTTTLFIVASHRS